MEKNRKRNLFYYILFLFITIISALFSIFVNKIPTNVVVNASDDVESGVFNYKFTNNEEPFYVENSNGYIYTKKGFIYKFSSEESFNVFNSSNSNINLSSFNLEYTFDNVRHEVPLYTDIEFVKVANIEDLTYSCYYTYTYDFMGTTNRYMLLTLPETFNFKSYEYIDFSNFSNFTNVTLNFNEFSLGSQVLNFGNYSISSSLTDKNYIFEAYEEQRKILITTNVDGVLTDYEFEIENGVVIPEPTKTDYTFLGWSTEKDNKEFIVEDLNSITENTTLYAIFEITTYNVTFYQYNNYNVLTVYFKTTGNFVYGLDSIPENNPTESGYTFLGWSTEKDNKELIVNLSSFRFDTDVKLYPIYEINYYDVNFFDNNGDLIDSFSIKYNTSYSSLYKNVTAPIIDGYNFYGWVTDKTDPLKVITSTYSYVRDNVNFYPLYEKVLNSENSKLYRFVNAGNGYINSSNYGFSISGYSNDSYSFVNDLPFLKFKILNNYDDVLSFSYLNIEFKKVSSTDMTFGTYHKYMPTLNTLAYDFIFPETFDFQYSNTSVLTSLDLKYLNNSDSTKSFTKFKLIDSVVVNTNVDDVTNDFEFSLGNNIELTNPVKDNYIFLGWSTEKDNKEFIVEDLNSIKVDTTLYAIFVKDNILCNLNYVISCGSFNLENIGLDTINVNGLNNNLGNYNVLDLISSFVANFLITDDVKINVLGFAYSLEYTELIDINEIVNLNVENDIDIFIIFEPDNYTINIKFFDVVEESYVHANLPYYIFEEKTYTLPIDWVGVDDIDIRYLDLILHRDGRLRLKITNNGLTDIGNNVDGKYSFFSFCMFDNLSYVLGSEFEDFLFYSNKVLIIDDYNDDIFNLNITKEVDHENNVVNIKVNYLNVYLITLNYFSYIKYANDDLMYTIVNNSITLPCVENSDINLVDFYNKSLFSVHYNRFMTELLVNIEGKEFYNQVPYLNFVGFDKEFSKVTQNETYNAVYDFNNSVNLIYYDKSGKLIKEIKCPVDLINFDDLLNDNDYFSKFLEFLRNVCLSRFGSIYNNLKDEIEFRNYLDKMNNIFEYYGSSASKSTITPYFLTMYPKVKLEETSNIEEFSCNLVSKSCLYYSGSYIKDDFIYVASPFKIDILEEGNARITITYGFILGSIVDVEDGVNSDGNDEDTDKIIETTNKILDKIGDVFKITSDVLKWFVLISLFILLSFCIVFLIIGIKKIIELIRG